MVVPGNENQLTSEKRSQEDKEVELFSFKLKFLKAIKGKQKGHFVMLEKETAGLSEKVKVESRFDPDFC